MGEPTGSKSVFLESFPKHWTGSPSVSKLIKLNKRTNIHLFPTKIPYPTLYQTLFPKNLQWRLTDMIHCIMSQLREGSIPFFYFLDLSQVNTTPLKASCKRDGIEYYKYPLVKGSENHAISEILKLIDSIPSPGYTSVFIIACEDGFEATGAVMSIILSRFSTSSIEEALAEFSDARPPGVYHESSIDLINSYLKTDFSFRLPQRPLWAEEIPEYPVTMSKLPRIDVISQLKEYGKPLSDSAIINQIMQLISSSLGPCFSLSGGILPIEEISVWTPGNASSLSNPSTMISISPVGTKVFLVLLDRNCFYLYFGIKLVFRFTTVYEGDLPVVCSATLTNFQGKLAVFVSDICIHAKNSFYSCSPEVRAGFLWNEVIPKIKPFDPRKSIRILFRPLAQSFFLTDLLKSDTGLTLNGALVLQANYPPGKSDFIPIDPVLTLYVEMNTKQHAVLHAISKENMIMVPLYVLEDATDELISLNHRYVDFKAIHRHPYLVPIGISTAHTMADHVFATQVLIFLQKGYMKHLTDNRDQDTKAISPFFNSAS